MILPKKIPSLVLGLALAGLGVTTLTAADPASPSVKPSQLQRGRYLVQQTSLCGDCHTPFDDHGQPIAAKALMGAGLSFKPLAPIPDWASYAPPIAGLPGFTDEQAIIFLTSGKDSAGKFARPPMPRFRFNQADAEAIVAYLRSLAPKK